MPNSAVDFVPLGELHDYAPFGQKADSSDLDDAIMAKTPWGYWPLGDIYDVSGNARHATAEVSPVWDQPQITSKANAESVQLANGRINLPLIQAHLSTQSGLYTYMGLVMMQVLPAPGSPVGNRYQGSIFLHQATDGAGVFDIKLGAQDIGDGGSLVIQSGTQIVGGVTNVFAINRPIVIALVGTSLPGLTWTWDVWANGVKVISGYPRSAATSGGTGYLALGRLGSAARVAQFSTSNWFAVASALSDTEIMSLTEVYLDKPAYNLAWRP